MTDLPLITSEDFDALEPEWVALHAATPGASPFLHPAWHRVWLRNFGQESSPVFLAVRREAALIGVAALDMGRDGARELGDHNVRDYAGPLAVPGEERAVAAGVLEWLREDMTGRLDLWGLPADSPLVAAFETASADGGWRYGRLSGDYNPLHWSGAYARRHGFGGAFLHPQRVLGQCLARLGARGATDLEAWIKGPVFYGAEVEMRSDADADGIRFALHVEDDARPAFVGRVGHAVGG